MVQISEMMMVKLTKTSIILDTTIMVTLTRPPGFDGRCLVFAEFLCGNNFTFLPAPVGVSADLNTPYLRFTSQFLIVL